MEPHFRDWFSQSHSHRARLVFITDYCFSFFRARVDAAGMFRSGSFSGRPFFSRHMQSACIPDLPWSCWNPYFSSWRKAFFKLTIFHHRLQHSEAHLQILHWSHALFLLYRDDACFPVHVHCPASYIPPAVCICRNCWSFVDPYFLLYPWINAFARRCLLFLVTPMEALMPIYSIIIPGLLWNNLPSSTSFSGGYCWRRSRTSTVSIVPPTL